MNSAMFERYSEPARRSLFFARHEASVLGSSVIEPAHLLLGVLKESAPIVEHLLGTANTAGDAIRQLTYMHIGASAPAMDTSVEIPFGNDSKRVLAYAVEEADRLLHHHIGPEHLVLGLLCHQQGMAWDVLRESGLELTAIREALVMHASATSPPPPQIAGMIAALIPGSQTRANRSPAVYRMIVLGAPSPGRRAAADDSAAGVLSSFSMVDFSTRADRPPDGRVHAIGPISMSGATLPQFASVLEPFLGGPVTVNDAATNARFDIELQGTYIREDALIAAVRDQLGLVLVRSR
jgi:hypothetical protein